MQDTPLVSVVIPAYNAEATIAETLDSVRQQTYRNLEIVVVDDGSRDRTVEVVRGVASLDNRVKLISQPNAGVAHARNNGIRQASADFIAPLDADDLWHATKIEKQLAVMLAGGSDLGMIYSPHRRIDQDGHVISTAVVTCVEGWVLYRHLDRNFVGNGSTPLIRKTALLEAGGYDPRLREQGVGGCEDYLMQLQIAKRYKFACVGEYLVGYREVPNAMSSDLHRMIRSRLMTYEIIAEGSDKDLRAFIEACTASFMVQHARDRIRRGFLADGVKSLLKALAADPKSALYHGAWHAGMTALFFAKLARTINSGNSASSPSKHFYEFSPTEGLRTNSLRATRPLLTKLEALDRTYGQSRKLRPDFLTAEAPRSAM